jgi:hypothetical protein
MTITDMKQVQCSSTSCPNRRRHHEDPAPRGPQLFWVPEDIIAPWFCSVECRCYYHAEVKEQKQLEEHKDETS